MGIGIKLFFIKNFGIADEALSRRLKQNPKPSASKEALGYIFTGEKNRMDGIINGSYWNNVSQVSRGVSELHIRNQIIQLNLRNIKYIIYICPTGQHGLNVHVMVPKKLINKEFCYLLLPIFTSSIDAVNFNLNILFYF